MLFKSLFYYLFFVSVWAIFLWNDTYLQGCKEMDLLRLWWIGGSITVFLILIVWHTKYFVNHAIYKDCSNFNFLFQNYFEDWNNFQVFPNNTRITLIVLCNHKITNSCRGWLDYHYLCQFLFIPFTKKRSGLRRAWNCFSHAISCCYPNQLHLSQYYKCEHLPRWHLKLWNNSSLVGIQIWVSL